jgi:hypothetical protein
MNEKKTNRAPGGNRRVKGTPLPVEFMETIAVEIAIQPMAASHPVEAEVIETASTKTTHRICQQL